ncbi:hypothetical protein CMI42_03360 [Candidatus Pacearchaeota archaeon]|nr:hypothetical protein [Candidatus Pacearchaeota archaeon]|tara:strand:+ start:1865 stop:2245 length:381 start_codon:yes stop_codon:yes gene_type:complete
MNFFNDDDPFENVVREFLGGKARRENSFTSGEEEERHIDLIENSEYVYIIFDLPGYNEEDIDINIRGDIIDIHVSSKNISGIQEYLHHKLKEGISLSKKLPKFINPKGYKKSFKNGILELKFMKNG